MGGEPSQSGIGERLERTGVAARGLLFEGRPRIWITGLLAALPAWQLAFGVPGAGIDPSWMGGLYMALDDGKDFGTDVVFTYGPLGFLAWPGLWFSWLAVVAFLFSAAIYLAFAVTLTWTLERGIGLLGAGVVTFLYLASIPDAEQLPLLLGVGWSLIALRDDRPAFALTLLAAGGGSLVAVETLIKLSVGPLIFAICVLALIGTRASRRHWALFGATSIGGLLVLWLLAGQPLGDLWDYAKNGAQVASGYNEAMALGGAPAWEQAALLLFAFGLVAATTQTRFRDARARWFAVALIALATFATFKYGIVRFEPNHAALALSAMLGMWLLIPWPRRLAVAFLTATAVLGPIAVHSYPADPRLDVVTNLRALRDTVELAARPGRRQQIVDESRANLQATYNLDPATLALLQDKRVAIDPWEIAVAWAYELDWQPLPVIQNYSAYTSDLDRLNAAAVEDPDGPEAILRANPGGTAPLAGSRSIEGRLPAWDPPEQNLATVCNFVPARTGPAWQVLLRVPNRCGKPEAIAKRRVGPGEAVAVPQAGQGELVVLRLHGVGVEGLDEQLRSLFWRLRQRLAVLNDGLVTYRLVPGTSEDGLIVSRDPALDSPDGFAQLPAVTNMRIEGVDRQLQFDFYRVPVRLAPRQG